MLESAIAAFRAGHFAQAEAQCRDLLARSPSDADALHLLGSIALQAGHLHDAEARFGESLAARDSAACRIDLATALRAQGRTEETRAELLRAIELAPDSAIAHFHLANTCGHHEAAQAEIHLRRAIALAPDFAEAHNNLGNLLRTSHPGEAEAAFRRAVELRPHFARAHFNLATLLATTQPEAAIEAQRRSLELEPGFAPAWNSLGLLLSERDPAEAEAALRRALELDPALAVAHFNLGNLLCETQRDEAATALRRAVELKPDFALAWTNLCHTLSKSHPEEAEAAARRAIALQPDLADAHYNLGCLLVLDRPDEAEPALRRAVALRPDHVDAWYCLGALPGKSRLDRTEAALRHVLELRPDHADAHAALGDRLIDTGLLDESIAHYRESLALNPAGTVAHSDLIFALAFQTDDAHAILDECRRFASYHELPYLAQPAAHANDRSPERRLRIGYVSPDFYHHCQSLFTAPVLAHHDHSACEIFCYSSVARPDDMTRRLTGYADVWRDVSKLDNDALAQTIRDDGIDVLVDLTMHMASNRRLLFARRPAPVQVAWLAYPGTTGSPAMDYRLTDPWLDPADEPGGDARYSERSIRLPDAFWCYEAQISGLPVNAPPAQGGAPFTFGCLNNPAKITDHALRLWSAAMAAVPGSRLLLLAPEGNTRARILARAAAHGIDAACVGFVEYQPRQDYLATWQRIDVALDTFPYNGHTTSLDAFWMGVPVVTRTGRSAPSRGGLSIAANLGLPELVAHTDVDFARIAADLARDLPRLAALRASLRTRMESSPLMDGKRFAAGLERAYRQMWRAWCEQSRA